MEAGACLVSDPRCPKWRFYLFNYWETQWCLKISSCYSIQGRWAGVPTQAVLFHCWKHSPAPGKPVGNNITWLVLLWQRHYFPINPFKMVLGFSPRCCLLILCKDTHGGRRKGGGVGVGEVEGSGELREGCVLGMLHSLGVEGEQTMPGECQYHRGEWVFFRLRNTFCFY